MTPTMTFSHLLHMHAYARIQRGEGAGHPLKSHKNIGFLSNSGPTFNLGPLLARQPNAI